MSNTNFTSHSEREKFVEFYQQNITKLSDLGSLFTHLGYRGDMDDEFPQLFGNIDMKLYSVTSTGDVEYLSNSGPIQKEERYSPPQAVRTPKSINENPTQKYPTVKNQFSWSSVVDIEMQHEGQPEKFDFGFIRPNWAWVQ